VLVTLYQVAILWVGDEEKFAFVNLAQTHPHFVATIARGNFYVVKFDVGGT
jgi:hypothetical protein